MWCLRRFLDSLISRQQRILCLCEFILLLLLLEVLFSIPCVNIYNLEWAD